MFLIKATLVVLLYYFAQEAKCLEVCQYYPDSMKNLVAVPIVCPDYCCGGNFTKTVDESCCGSKDLGLWWIAIGCGIALIVCLFVLLICCCCNCKKAFCCG